MHISLFSVCSNVAFSGAGALTTVPLGCFVRIFIIAYTKFFEAINAIVFFANLVTVMSNRNKVGVL
jgi:hypothetical protein